MSYYDVTIVCSPILAGKPLHMHRRTATVRLHTLPASTPNNRLQQKFQFGLVFRCLVSEPISVPVTLSPRYFSVPSYHRLVYYKGLYTSKNKQINNNMGKIRWVDAQGNHKNIYTITITILQPMPPS